MSTFNSKNNFYVYTTFEKSHTYPYKKAARHTEKIQAPSSLLLCYYCAEASFSARFSQTFARSIASYRFGRSEVFTIAFTGFGSFVDI